MARKLTLMLAVTARALAANPFQALYERVTCRYALGP